MAFTYEEMMQLENPYEELGSGDALAENREVLDALSAEEKRTIASKIVKACPERNMRWFGLQMQALKNMVKKEDTFFPVLANAHMVKHRILALLDQRNPTPHALFLAQEAQLAIFHQFNDLAQDVLKTNASAIAERLALATPEDSRGKVVRSIDSIFPQSHFLTQTQAAFTLRHNIEQFLLGDQPELFFTSPDFDKAICDTFATLLRTLLKGHEENIGNKLSSTELDTHIQVMHQLELLSTEAFDEANPFKLIAARMSPEAIPEQNKKPLHWENPYTLFSSRPATPILRPATPDSRPVTPTEFVAKTGISFDELLEGFDTDDLSLSGSSDTDEDTRRAFCTL